jgi:hypothetical protein
MGSLIVSAPDTIFLLAGLRTFFSQQARHDCSDAETVLILSVLTVRGENLNQFFSALYFLKTF